MIIPCVIIAEQAGTNTREPSTSTTQILQREFAVQAV
jgi:hypothetical protein